jgi:predicted acylesterase/phospholipase RssA
MTSNAVPAANGPGVNPGPDGLPKPIAGRPITEMTEDVRFALSMAGGVSLAVWMGGVSREVNLLQQASDARSRSGGGITPPWAGPVEAESAWDASVRTLYQNLLELLDVTVTVDVLSGTSAGGINAALLGMSSADGLDLGMLRDLWLDTGSLDILLRDPGEKNPPSLMQGDRVLYAKLAAGIQSLHNAPRARAAHEPRKTTVYITTTMMSGETSRFTDSYGTLVPDVDHHGLFTFDERALAPQDAYSDGSPLTALALAARSSASFPGAFEPSFIPIGEPGESDPGVPARPDMHDYANMTRSHWVADGGLLANRPLTPLLSTVFARPADREVRRVLAFVVPDGGGNADPQDIPEDKWGKPFTLATALRNDLDAQLSQSIATDLEAIRAHNERVQAGHDLRRTLAEIGVRLDGQRLVTPRMMDDYTRQQGAALARPLLKELMRQMTTMKLPGSWEKELGLGPGRPAEQPPIEQRLARTMMAEFTREWRYPPIGAYQGSSRSGSRPDAERSSEAASPPGSSRSGNPGTGEPPPSDGGGRARTADPFYQMALFGLPALHGAQAIAVHLVRLGYLCANDKDDRGRLAAHRKEIRKAVEPPAPFDDHKWVGEYVRSKAKAQTIPALEELATQLAAAKRTELKIGLSTDDDRQQPVAESWRQLGKAVISLLATLDKLAAGRPSDRPQHSDAAEAITTYTNFFRHPISPNGQTGREVASRLLDLIIAQRALQPVEAEVDQPVEFIQISANTRTLLSDQTAVTKLRGDELHHFAAFYKSSWRAFDWMWGRLDGCGWLVHILLDPRRILAVCENDPKTFGKADVRPENFLQKLLPAVGMTAVDSRTRASLLKDLEFLKGPEKGIPASLPNFALFLARAWQDLVAANELPIIARQMLADDGHLPASITQGQPESDAVAAGKPASRSSAKPAAQARNSKPAVPPNRWAATVLEMRDSGASPGSMAAQLPACPVQNETLGGQLRTPAFARTASKAAAVATAALATAPETPPSIRPVLTSARTVTHTGYRATQVTGGNPLKMLIGGLVLAVIGGVLATQGMIIVGMTGTIIALAGLYLVALGAWGLHRGVLGAIVGITALALIAALTLAWVRKFLWGDGAKTAGWVPGHVIPWLRTTWWGGLTLLGGFLALAAIFGILMQLRARHDLGHISPYANSKQAKPQYSAMSSPDRFLDVLTWPWRFPGR